MFAITFKIKSVSIGKVLDYPLQVAQQNQAVQVSPRDDNGGFNQHWKIKTIRQNPGGDNIVQFVCRINGFLLDLPNSSRDVSEQILVSPEKGA
ncbi:MAG: RICIN domain-containing protein [Chitinophagaceae bacterium]